MKYYYKNNVGNHNKCPITIRIVSVDEDIVIPTRKMIQLINARTSNQFLLLETLQFCTRFKGHNRN